MQHPDEGRLHEFADGALPARERAEVEAHLAACEACRKALGDVHALVGESDRLVSRLELDPPLRIPAAPPAPARAVRPWYLSRTVGLAASALLVVGLGWLAVGRRPAAESAAPDAGLEVAAKEEAAAAAAPAPRDLAAAPEAQDNKAVPEASGAGADAQAAAPAAPPAAAAESRALDRARVALRADTPPAGVPLNDLPARKPRVVGETTDVPLNDLPTREPKVAQEAPAAGVPLNDLPTHRPQVLAAPPPGGNAPAPRYAIEGLDPVSHDSLPGGGTRTVYSVNGTRVELDQGPGAAARRERSAQYEVGWTQDGTRLALRAALPPAEVEALRRRVR